ncbi:helix-turn-helix domain-containing protein [Clostridium thermobutyricum]|uniref:winged helix-turn-helix transcriptional regulator n=1 Tax=Clostridium thermobutyricum TaxID=29372 RepID=UPI0018A9CC96|nr:helix-turn-helix domain-containing protein [Clostridium thermobutyricum]
MKKKKLRDEDAIEKSLKLLSGKWRLRVILEIYKEDKIRFNKLQKNIDGISSIMLTRILKELIENKLVLREQFDEIPPHVEYSLTREALGLCQVFNVLEDLGKKLK